MPTSLIDEVVKLERGQEQEAVEEIFAIARRSNAPKKGDAELLKRCMEKAGYTSADLQRLFDIAKKAASLKEAAAEADDPVLQTEIQEAAKAVDSHQAETERIQRQRDAEHTKLFDLLGTAQRRFHRARTAQQRLNELMEANPRLFGLKVEPESPAAHVAMRFADMTPDGTPIAQSILDG